MIQCCSLQFRVEERRAGCVRDIILITAQQQPQPIYFSVVCWHFQGVGVVFFMHL